MALDNVQNNSSGDAEALRLNASYNLYIDVSSPAPVLNKLTDTTRSGSSFYDWISGNADYLAQAAAGAADYAYQQAKDHPWETAGLVGLGVVAVAAAPVAGFLGASAAVVAGIDGVVTVGGTGLAVYSGASGVAELANSSTGDGANNAYNVLTHPEGHSPEEIAAAEQCVRENLGPGTFATTMGVVGAAGAAGAGFRMAGALGKAAEVAQEVPPKTLPPLEVTPPETPPPAQTPPEATPPAHTPPPAEAPSPDVPAQKPVDGEVLPPHPNDFREPLLTDKLKADTFTNRFKDLFTDWEKGQPNNPLVKARAAADEKIVAAQDEFADAASAKTGVSSLGLRMRLHTNNDAAVQRLLGNDPELLQKYADLKEKTNPLNAKIREIDRQLLDQKQDQVRGLVDAFCKENGLPTPEIEFNGYNRANASYEKGVIKIPAENAIDPNRDLVRLLGHELTHLEQDALAIRYLAQKLNIKSDGSDADILRLTDAYASSVRSGYLPHDFAMGALKAAQDQPLSPEEIARAEKIIPSFHNYHTVPDLRPLNAWNNVNLNANNPALSVQQIANSLSKLSPEILGKLPAEVEEALSQAKTGVSGDDANLRSTLMKYISARTAEEAKAAQQGLDLYKGNYVEQEARAAEELVLDSVENTLHEVLPAQENPLDDFIFRIALEGDKK